MQTLTTPIQPCRMFVGDPKNTVTVLVDGKDCEITVNLDSALRHIRGERRSKLMWADALCINQKDDDEKAEQVKQIGDEIEGSTYN